MSLVFTACGETAPPPQPSPTSTPTATADGGWYWKPGGFIDYAPSGMPDFDQKQDMWSATAAAPTWSYCGPVAMANSLWWFDSKYEPSPVAPPTVNDNYPLVQSYSPVGAALWDDHDPQNVALLVEDLAGRMDTDGQTSGGSHMGTNVEDMHNAVNQYIIDKGLQNVFYAHLERSPEFDWIEQEVERCQDVVLLLGFWQWHEADPTHASGQGEWVRIGGHYVTCAGVNSEDSKLGISDPYWDNAEAGGEGRIPVSHTYPHNVTVHNDAQYVSHDIYNVIASESPGGPWALEDYASDKDVSNFEGQNWASDLLSYQGDYNANLEVHVEIDYAVAVSPFVVPTTTPTATRTEPPTKTAGPTSTMTTPPTGPTSTRTDLPTGEPTEPGGPTATATRTTVPPGCPNAPVITGIHSVHRVNPTGGGFTVEIHCIPAYFPKGTNIYDLHFFSSDGAYLGSEYFETPLVSCTTYTFDIPTPPGAGVPECITICLTDQNHDTWGRIASWLVGPTVVDLTTHLTDWGTGIFEGTTYWEIEIHPETEYFGPPGTPTDIYDLHFWALEDCDPIGLGVEYFQADPLVSDEWYDFILEVSATSPPPDVVLVEVTDASGVVWGVAWSWPYSFD